MWNDNRGNCLDYVRKADWFQIGKGVRQGCILSPGLFELYAECIMRNTGMKQKLESRLLGEISITSGMQMTPHFYGRKWRRTKPPLDESERGEWKSWLKTQHSENKDHASGFISSWQIDGETMETVKYFILGGSKITADGDHSHEIERHFFLGRKAMTNLDSILKSRDITLPTKVHLVSYVFFQ